MASYSSSPRAIHTTRQLGALVSTFLAVIELTAFLVIVVCLKDVLRGARRTDPRMGNSLDSFDHSVEVPLAPKSAGACHAIDVADEPLAEAG